MLSECWLMASPLSRECLQRTAHSMAEMTFHHLWHPLSPRSKSQSPTFHEDEEIMDGAECQKAGISGVIQEVAPRTSWLRSALSTASHPWTRVRYNPASLEKIKISKLYSLWCLLQLFPEDLSFVYIQSRSQHFKDRLLHCDSQDWKREASFIFILDASCITLAHVDSWYTAVSFSSIKTRQPF